NLGRLTADFAARLLEQQRIDHLAAGFALVAGRARRPAVMANAADVTVRQEAVGAGIEELFARFLGEEALIEDVLEKCLTERLVCRLEVGLVGSAVHVEIDSQGCEVAGLLLVEVGRHFLRRFSLLVGRYLDRNAVVVASADEERL